jgi:predicted MPP superfamily phosphohydrolase
MRMRKRNISLAVAIAILLALVAWTVWGNTALEQNTYTIQCDHLSKSFDGYRIAHISDLHNAEMGKNNEKLLAMLRDAQPDVIAITGDLIDSRNTNISIALQFAKEAVRIAPCYYVTGNHESRVSDYDKLKSGLLELGVVVLENEKMEIHRNEESITVFGVNDPSFETGYILGDAVSVMNHSLQQLEGEENFTVLLSHRPELMDVYAEHGVDLVLSGHAHGGQFRLPLLGGVFAPNQGMFPKYDSGLFEKENTKMIVSRGIGNSIIPLRFNNRPEMILVELRAAG